MNNPILKIQNARLSFPVLFTPKAETDEQGQPKAGKLKYSVTLLLDKNLVGLAHHTGGVALSHNTARGEIAS